MGENIAGKCIGRYLILEKLSESGMAVVFKALETRLKREVVIKLIKTDNPPPSILNQMLKCFEREDTALTRLSHPNNVLVYDLGDYEHATDPHSHQATPALYPS